MAWRSVVPGLMRKEANDTGIGSKMIRVPGTHANEEASYPKRE